MSTPRWSRIIGAALAIAVPFLPAAAASQLTPAMAQAEADRLHDNAEALANASSANLVAALPAVAHVHGEAANLRVSGDPRAEECLEFQASLHFLIGEYSEAQTLMERVAWMRTVTGDHVGAAFAYIAAAEAAIVQDRSGDTVRLVSQVARIPQIYPLTAEERSTIYRLVQ